MEKEITISDIVIHAKSKKEIFHVLTVEGGLYLPPINDSNKKYIQNIMKGFKKFFYAKNVKVVKTPHIKGLSIKEIIAWAKDNQTLIATCQHIANINILTEIGSATNWIQLRTKSFKSL